MAIDTAPFVWGAGGARLTPEEIALQRKSAQALMASGMDMSPIASPWQGAARVAQALMGGYEGYRADEASKQNAAKSSQLVAALLGGAGGATATAAAPAVSSPASAASPSVSTPMGATAIPAGKDEFVNSIMPMVPGGFGQDRH